LSDVTLVGNMYNRRACKHVMSLGSWHLVLLEDFAVGHITGSTLALQNQ